MTLRSPIWWFGGKGHQVKRILPLFPPHRIYVEPFGGGASLLFAKEPSKTEVYNDLDSGLVRFFRVLRDPEKFARFYHLACLTPYSREEYYFCRDTQEECEDEVEGAYRWFVMARQSFGGRLDRGWSYIVDSSSRGMASTCSRWLSTLEILPAISRRLMRVQIEHQDFRQIFKAYDTPDTLFYCDPPYVLRTRRSGGYRCEMTDDDHRELVDLLLGLKGKAVLSGYANEIYRPLEDAGWQRHDSRITCFVGRGTRGTGVLEDDAAKRMRVESVWVSPDCAHRSLFHLPTG
jgi:DNA adenine methylase